MRYRWIYLVRHGQYDMTPGSRTRGHLTTTGRRQARHLSRRLRRLPIDVIHHSDLARAVETADILRKELRGVDVRSSRSLREGLPGMKELPHRKRHRVDRARMDRAYERLVRPCRGRDRHEVVVCHGNIIRYLIMRTLDVHPATWFRIDTLLCSVSLLRVSRRDGARVSSINDVSHLPEALRVMF